MPSEKKICDLCGGDLQEIGGLFICPACNDRAGEFYGSLTGTINKFSSDSNKVLIECPGATLYKSGTNEIEAGTEFIDNDDPSRGFRIINHPVYGPNHTRFRWVKKSDIHLIRRCKSCQDYTVKMRRKEGPDLYIPSRKYPRQRPGREPGSDFRNRAR